MAEWRTGRKLGVTLYRDEVFVGHVCSAMVAAEIVETMNRVGKLLDEVRGELTLTERGMGRSPEEWRAAADRALAKARSRECTCPEPRPLTDWTDHPEAQPADAERRSEATPQNDLCRGCGQPSHGFACPAQLEAARREEDLLSRVDPYDTTKGGAVDG